NNKITSSWIKQIGNIASQRNLPRIQRPNFKRLPEYQVTQKTEVILLIDEFINYMAGSIAEDSIVLLRELGYQVTIVSGLDTGRSFLSKGYLDQAQGEINKNLNKIAPILKANSVLVGIEPSAILS